MTLSELASIFAIIFGTVGMVLGYLSYFRDRAKITVTLQWDMNVSDNPKYDSNKNWGLVTVTNIGRRPIFISKVALVLPKGIRLLKKYVWVELLLDSVKGTKLLEGDPPYLNIFDQAGLEEYSKTWTKINAEVMDSAGKIYKAKRIDKNKIPSWAKVNKKRNVGDC